MFHLRCNIPAVNDHVVYVYWIDTVYVQNILPNEFSKMTIFHNLKKIMLKRCNIPLLIGYEKEAHLY